MTEYRGDRTTGFASPAADHVDGSIELADVLDLRRPNRYPVRVSGDALIGRGIRHGDILIVDSALSPSPGVIVVASVGDEMRVCELTRDRAGWWLRPSMPGDAPIIVDELTDVAIWAIASGLVRTDV